MQLPGTADSSELHSTDEKVSPPVRKAVAGVERQARRGNRRNPDNVRRLHALFERASAKPSVPRTVAPKLTIRPAVVGALLDDVDLVAALRTVLRFPDRARVRMDREPHHVPVAEGPDLRLRIGLTHERIVRRDGAVIAKTQNLALVCIGPLCDRIVGAAHHHVQVSVGSKCHRRPGCAVRCQACQRQRAP